LSPIFEFEEPLRGAPEVKLTDDGYLYYADPQNERDIWIARRAPAEKMTRIGR